MERGTKVKSQGYKEYIPKSIDEKYVLETTTNYGFLQVSKTYIRLFGFIKAGILINYLDKEKYFNEHFPNNDGWFFLTHKSIADEFNIKEYTVQTSKNEFEELGILETEMRTNPTKQWLRINHVKLSSLVKNHLNSYIPPSKVTREKTWGSPPRKLGVPTPKKTKGYNNNKLNKNIKENNNKNLLVNSGKIQLSNFDKFWELYPKKAGKGQALTAWTKLCKQPVKERPNWKNVYKALKSQKESIQWKAGVIPNASTWLNQSRWLNDAESMTYVPLPESKSNPKQTLGSVDKNRKKYIANRSVK